MEKGEKILQDDAVTIQPYWRSLYNHAKDNIAGGEHHISFEIDPAMLAWKA
jgi:peptide/nickel transport system substrate-binding protein